MKNTPTIHELLQNLTELRCQPISFYVEFNNTALITHSNSTLIKR